MAKAKTKIKTRETTQIVLKLTEREAQDLRFVIGKCAGTSKTVSNVYSALCEVVEATDCLTFNNRGTYPSFSEKTDV